MKRKITTKEEANDYYDRVNSKVDEYIEEWNIRPSRLRAYLSAEDKMARFLRRAELEDVDGIDRVVADVLEDREAMESDMVLTFESFGTGEPEEGHERAAAEHCRVSLGHVSRKDGFEGTYEVEDIGETRTLRVMSADELDEFREMVAERLAERVLSEQVDVHALDVGLESGREVRTRLSLAVSEIVNEKALGRAIREKLTREKTIKVATDWINDYPVRKAGIEFRHAGSRSIDGKEYQVWESTG